MSMITELRKERTRLDTVIEEAQRKAQALDEVITHYKNDKANGAQRESKQTARNGAGSRRREPCPVRGCSEKPKPGAGLSAHMRARHPDYVLQ